MKNPIIALCVFILSSISIISQDHNDGNINPFWEFYSLNYLSSVSAGRGFTGIAAENDISGFNLNPASIELSSKNQFNAQYTYKTSQAWLQGTFFSNLYLRQQLFSGSLGYGRKINDKFQIGFVYNNPSGMYFDMGEIIKTNQFGEEISRYDNYYDISSHSINVPVVYNTKRVKFGLSLNYLLSRYVIPGEEVTTINNPEGFTNGSDYVATSHFFRLHAGFIVRASDKISIGAKVVTGGKSDVTAVYPDGTNGDQVQTANYPWRAGAGIQYTLNKVIKILLDYNYTRTSMLEGLKDRHDGHIGIEGLLEKNWILRAGFFTLFDIRKNEGYTSWGETLGEYDQYFLTFGASYFVKNFAANIAVLTSEISPGKIKNTYINGGLTFNF